VYIFPVGVVGKDGGELIEFFKKNSIDTSYVLEDNKLYTATGKVITDMNDNQIWGFYYGACAIDPMKNSRLWTLDSKQDFWILSATHEKPFTSTLRHVIKNKLPYLFDPGMALTWIRDDLLKKGVMNAQYVIGNDYEIAMIEKRLGMKVDDLNKAGISVIITLGADGVRFNPTKKSSSYSLDSRLRGNDNTSTGKQIIVKAVRLRKVVDPTGAGDAWRGGFVGALMAGKPMRECLVMGNVMASFAVESVGTVEYKANALEITKRIRTLDSGL
jgi:adenosine kinase